MMPRLFLATHFEHKLSYEFLEDDANDFKARRRALSL